MKRQSESGLFNWIYDPIYFKQNISRKRREGKGEKRKKVMNYISPKGYKDLAGILIQINKLELGLY